MQHYVGFMILFAHYASSRIVPALRMPVPFRSNVKWRIYSRLQSIIRSASRTRSFVEEGNMRRFVVALLATSALSVAAQAADMPAKAPVLKAAPIATYNWTASTPA
jgi:hypothetical protein